MKVLSFALLALCSSAFAENCTHCGQGIKTGVITVKTGGKTYPVRCMLCARDLAAQYPGAAVVQDGTLTLNSDDQGNWTSSKQGVVFLEVEGDHKDCNAWSKAFASQGEFDSYVKGHPAYKNAKALTLAEWSQHEGHMDHADHMDHKHMPGMDMHDMGGRLGPWQMGREGSGTSLLPESSPMFMKMLPKVGRYDLMLMGMVTANYADAGGKRGDSQFFSNSMPMLMARRETGGGILGFNVMASADALFNGERGYPDLFQTGETAHGQPLVDRQHPHDLISEFTASYSHPLSKDTRWFVYGGPVGEPALGGPMYLHRPSGMDIPETPISHHWFDATHISWGVITLGLNNAQWQVEGSTFNGHEPDENRFAPDPISLNSASGRVTYNPSRDLSFNAAFGYLKAPEKLEPGVDQHRLTFSGLYNLALENGDNLAVTGAFGRNYRLGGSTDAFLLEATLLHGSNSLFARYENVNKDELVGVPVGAYKINKFLFGGMHNLASRDGFDYGVGAYAGVYSFPSSLDAFYGKNPVTLGVFLRVRPSRMSHDMAMAKKVSF